MSTKNFTLDVVTPTKTIFSGEVQSFTAPGTMGSFQVLHNHAPLLSTIGIGEVKVIDSGGKQKFFATSGGFVEVNNNKVILLAETAESAEEINKQRAEEAKKRAEERLQTKKEVINQERARAALMRAINRLKVSAKN